MTDHNSQGFDPDRLALVTTWMNRYIETRKFPGASLLVYRGGKEVFYADTGRRSIEDDLPFERDTVARIYSMTKPITSVALMQYVENGHVHLDAPLSEFLPDFADMQALIPDAQRLDQTEPAAPITLHHLLTHTSGLSYGFNPSLVSQAMSDQKLDFAPRRGILSDSVAALSDLPLGFQPGSRWEYSVAIDVLGRVLEVLSGRSLSDVLREQVLEPLGMDDTGFRVRDDQLPRFASLYTPLADDAFQLTATAQSGDTLRLLDNAEDSPFRRAGMFSGGGGLVGTIDDYMRFTEMLRRGGSFGDARILGPGTLRFMTRNHLPGDIASMGQPSFAEQPMRGMGFGLGGSVVLDPAAARIPGNIGDFSWGGMASTFFWVDPVLDLSVVFFTQLAPSSSYPARAELKALIHGALTS